MSRRIGVRLGLDRESEIVFEDDLQAPPRQLQLFFTMHVRIRHRARADHALLPFGLQCSRQEFRRILLDLLRSSGACPDADTDLFCTFLADTRPLGISGPVVNHSSGLFDRVAAVLFGKTHSCTACDQVSIRDK